jgi:uncharacterized membrane protein YcaP (DUF421 family)
MPYWISIFIKSLIFFIITFALTRIMGKTNPSKATPFKFVSYIIMGIIAALISVDIIKNEVIGFIALATWTILTGLLDYLSLKSKWAHDLIYGKPTVLIKDGKVMEENLIQMKLTGEELLSALRTKNIFKLADVEFAVMESTGDINALFKSDKTPITPHDIGTKVATSSEPQTVILDGNIIDESLGNIGLNRQWLDTELQKVGVSIDNVFIGQVDSSGDLYIDTFDDVLQIPQPQVKKLLYANLEKCQADFMSFSLETENKKAKKMFLEDAEKLEEIMGKLKPYLLH